MVDTKNITGPSTPDLTGLARGTTGSQAPGAAEKKKNEDVSKTEFLQILVTQLKSQDPLDPMKNDQFAVDLAQFSQLEQLISINDKMGGGTDVSSLAGYLGQEVTLDSDQVRLEDGEGASLRFDLAGPVTKGRVDLTDADGKVVGSMELAAMEAGEHTVLLSVADLPAGDYGFKVVAESADGGEVEPKSSVVGTVSGFVPGPDPQLIVGGREVSPSKVLKVNVPKSP